MLKRVTILLLALAASFISFSQVTTSSMAGTVKDNNGQPLTGASVTAVHTPSGTTYSTIAGKNGVFNIPNMRAGGPYSLKITFTGLEPYTLDNLTLELGQSYSANAVLTQSAQVLEAVVVGSRARRAAVDRIGMSTNIGSRQLSTLPTISRSITDFTRITPQSNGTSFAGRDNRMNNVTVDGANLNNNFGLSSDLLPGGGNPIALDAFQEISVNMSPFDVKQSGFTGASVNAITKSGTNTFHGSVYGSYRNQSYNGTNIAGNKLPNPPATSNKIYGATIGGPIIKNKLFFFLNGEIEKSSFPGITYAPKGGSGNGTVSNVLIDSLQVLSAHLNSQYGFDPGAYDNFPNFENKNHKVLAKIDWNISTRHKLTVKFSDFKNTGDAQISASGGINGASGQSAIVVYTPLPGRFGPKSKGF